MAIQYPFRNALYLPLGLMCAVTPLAMGCSGLQGRRSPMPVNPQFHENAGFCETSWRPLAGGSMEPRQSLEAPVEYTLPPIIDSGEVPLTAPVRHRRPVNPGAKPLHSRQYSAQSSVRHAAGARPVATQIPQGKRYRVRDHSHDAEQRDAEGSLLDYYAP